MNMEVINLRRYVLIFGGYYAGFMALINILAHGLNIDLGSGGNMAMLLASAYVAAAKFVAEVGRVPSLSEKRSLSLGCLGISYLVSLLGVLIVIPIVVGVNGLKEILDAVMAGSPLLVFGFALAITLLYYFILSINFGWVAGKIAKARSSQ